MAVSFLLDEHVEPQVSERLATYGYDVERVGDGTELELGATDDEIAAYSKRRARVVLTYDDDFVTEYDESAFHCVVFFENEALSARDVADIAHSMADTYPESAFTGVVYGHVDWL